MYYDVGVLFSVVYYYYILARSMNYYSSTLFALRYPKKKTPIFYF